MPAVTLDFDSDTSISLESQMQRLALEAEAIANVVDTFKNLVPSLYEKLFTQYSQLTGDTQIDEDVKEMKLTFGNMKVKLRLTNYMNYNKTLISVPEGFKGDLLSYVHCLSSMATEVFQEANKTLGEYNFALSAFITNKESKISLKDHSDLFYRVQQTREKLTQEISNFFPNGSDLSKNYLGDVIHRFADLEELVRSAEKLNQQHKEQNIKAVQDSVKKSVDLLKIIVDDTRTNGIAKVSGNAAMNISQGAYELGKYVEFISIYRFRVEQVVSTIEKLLKKLDEIM